MKKSWKTLAALVLTFAVLASLLAAVPAFAMETGQEESSLQAYFGEGEPLYAEMTCCTVHAVTDWYSYGVVVAASYTPDGRMLEVHQSDANSFEFEHTLAFDDLSQAGCVKVFYLDDGTMQPQSTVMEFHDVSGRTHSFQTKTKKEATCQNEGEIERICTGCGYSRTETVPKTAHTEAADAAVPATCTDSGLTAGSHCAVCGTVIQKQEMVPALGHSYVNGVCTRCGAADESEEKTLTLTKSAITLRAGSATILFVSNEEYYETAQKEFVWTSSNPDVATVTNGTIKALGPGTTTITASKDERHGNCVVTVWEDDPAQTTFDFLVEYVKNNAWSRDGDVYHFGWNQDDCFMTMSYRANNNTLTVGSMLDDGTSYSTCMVYIPPDLNAPYDGAYVFQFKDKKSSSLVGLAHVYPDQLMFQSGVSMYSWDGPSNFLQTAQSNCNAGIAVALRFFELTVFLDTARSFKDLGFTALPYDEWYSLQL